MLAILLESVAMNLNLNRRGWLLGAVMTPLAFLFRGAPAAPLTTEADKSLIWGTYGKGTMEDYEAGRIKKLPPVTWKKLDDCDTDHLIRILKNQPIQPSYKTAISHILTDRGISRRKIENWV
jgi:hypothetical protein